NKKVFSGDIGLYQKIVSANKAVGTRYLNESTVGVGLPVINTLKELVAAGDKVIKIEGVFSGMMSYIFNEFSNGKPDQPTFSSMVKAAWEKGYTLHSHPADDLNRFDVFWQRYVVAPCASSFLVSLDTLYNSFPQRILEAEVVGVTEAIANLTDLGVVDPVVKATVTLSESGFVSVTEAVAYGETKDDSLTGALGRYPVDHPFSTSLGSSNNIIMFHMERHSPRPLIVQLEDASLLM
ncbi:hypothetical protein JOM56_012946, partial [Amanita muscaria]